MTFNVKQLVTEPTRPVSGTLLDHIIVRSTDAVTSATVIPCSWSDHDIIVAETVLRRERRRPAEIAVRSTRSLEPSALCLDLLLSDWSAVHGAAEPADKWSAWLAVWDARDRPTHADHQHQTTSSTQPVVK